MSSSALSGKQSLKLATILAGLGGSQVNAYFALLNDDRILRRHASANIQSRASTLVAEAKTKGRGTLIDLVESVLEDSGEFRMKAEYVTELQSMKSTLDGSLPSGLVQAVETAAAVMEISSADLRPGPTAEAAVRLADERNARESETVPEVAKGAWSPAPFPLVAAAESTEMSPTIFTANSVFLVQGRNERINESMTAYLTSLGLTVFDWDEVLTLAAQEKNQSNPFILDVVEKGMAMAAVVVVLITPDETASLREEAAPDAEEHELVEGFQPRPNVLIEAGMALARDRGRTLLVQWGESRALSDLGGMHVARIAQDTNARGRLRSRLMGMKLSVAENQRWQTAGDFRP